MLDLANLSGPERAHDEIDAALFHRILVIDARRIELERGYRSRGRALVVGGRGRGRCGGWSSRGCGGRSARIGCQNHINRDIASQDIEDGLAQPHIMAARTDIDHRAGVVDRNCKHPVRQRDGS